MNVGPPVVDSVDGPARVRRSCQACVMRGTWTRPRVATIAFGGAAGAGARWAVVTTVDAGQFPWPVFALNVAGSILLGALLAVDGDQPRTRLLLHDAGGIGFCGGLTTFSTFAVEVVDLVRAGRASTAGVYAVTSVAFAILGVIGGGTLGRWLHALPLPVEKQP